MPTLLEDLRALINAPGAVTKSDLLTLAKKQPKETVDTEAELLALDAEAVLRSEGGYVYAKENGPGQDGFREAGNAHLHSASDISLPATLLSDGSR